MKRIFTIMMALSLAGPLDAGKVEGRGRKWLDEHQDAPQINVTGTWVSVDWGTIELTQAQGSRDVTGTDGNYQLTGVASGKNLYLLFAKKSGAVAFCGSLVSESDSTLIGTYSYRVTSLRLGFGLCQGKGYRLGMTRAAPGKPR